MSETRPFAARYDAIVVGARCAGAATAMLLARAGAKVLLVDRQRYGSDTVSTHALMRAGVLQLRRWGLLEKVLAAGTPPVRRSTFHYGYEQIPIAIKPEHGVSFLCAPRRTVLDRVLIDAARAAGVDVRHGVCVTDLRFAPDGRVDGVHLKCGTGRPVTVGGDLVIGADGRRSKVAHWAGAAVEVSGTGASGYVYGYFRGLPDDGYHWYFADGVAAGAIPTNDRAHCVFVGVPQDRFAATFRGDLAGGFARIAAANAPHLSALLENAVPMGRLRGFSGGVGYLRRAHGPGWALVGDTGYFKDPLTAHGITDAFRDAELLSRAVLSGREAAFAAYQAERDALSWPLFRATDRIARFGWTRQQLQTCHGQLSDAMKAETVRIAGFADRDNLAA